MIKVFANHLIITLVLLIGVFIVSAPDVFAQTQSEEYKLIENIPGVQGKIEDARANGDTRNVAVLKGYAQGVFQIATWIVAIAALLMIVVGGFIYLTSAGNQSQTNRAKEIIRDALYGLLVVLFSVLLLQTINPDLVRINLSSQNLITTQPSPGGETQPSPGGSRGSQAGVSTCGSQCVEVDGNYDFNHKSEAENGCKGGPCKISTSIGNKLQEIYTDGFQNFKVSELSPPSVNHKSPCHSQGSCVDVSMQDFGYSNSDIKTFYDKTTEKGLRSVYEIPKSSTSTARKQQLIAAGVPDSSIVILSGISGEHFSVYDDAST